MTSSALEEAAYTLWAKSGDPFLTLLVHMVDTAAVTWKVIEREPDRTRRLYAQDWSLPEDEALRLVAFLSGLHDLGKASPVFQSTWRKGGEKVWELGLTWNRKLVDHCPVSHAALTEIYSKQLLRELGLPRTVARKVAQGLGAHHGIPAPARDLELSARHEKNETGPWKEVRSLLARSLAHTLGLPLPLRLNLADVPPAAVIRLMALASFADWIASDRAFFPYGRAPHGSGRWRETLELAQRALDALPWPRARRTGIRGFSELFTFSPNPLQSTVPVLLAKVGDKPVLLMVEAPMGLGKTEAALYAYHLLRERLGHRGLYLALPTQATANGLFPRVRSFLERLSEGEKWELQLQHGAALLNVHYGELLERATPVQVYDPEGSDVGGAAASVWFSARKRAMLSGHGVGTLDQALLGVLMVKHHFIRLWGLMNRVVVLDEVHAYDTYTSGLLLALLRWLRALDSSVVLMTATLPSSQRKELLAAWGVEQVELPPYPRVAAFEGEELLGSCSLHLEPKRVRLEPAPVEVGALARILQARLPGALGAVVNTVDRAQALYQALGGGERLTLAGLLDLMGGGTAEGAWSDLAEQVVEKGALAVGKRLPDDSMVFLLHARFPAEERALREAVALALFGRHGPRPERAILVATQVAEQSLDLDFDLLYSDLAPVDLVLQRIGRLHRHERPRPGVHGLPLALVGGLGEVPDFGGDLYWNAIYEDYVLLSTWAALKRRSELNIPKDIEGLLEEVYERNPEEFPDEHRARARESYRRLQHRRVVDARSAHNLSLSDPDKILSRADSAALTSEFALDDEAEDPRVQRFLTRLGDPSVAVVFLYRIGEEWFFDPEAKRPARLQGEVSREEALALWSRAVRLSRYPIPQTLSGENPPPAWQRSGLLKNLRPLEVGRSFPSHRGILRALLHPELGVLYEEIRT